MAVHVLIEVAMTQTRSVDILQLTINLYVGANTDSNLTKTQTYATKTQVIFYTRH